MSKLPILVGVMAAFVSLAPSPLSAEESQPRIVAIVRDGGVPQFPSRPIVIEESGNYVAWIAAVNSTDKIVMVLDGRTVVSQVVELTATVNRQDIVPIALKDLPTSGSHVLAVRIQRSGQDIEPFICDDLTILCRSLTKEAPSTVINNDLGSCRSHRGSDDASEMNFQGCDLCECSRDGEIRLRLGLFGLNFMATLSLGKSESPEEIVMEPHRQSDAKHDEATEKSIKPKEVVNRGNEAPTKNIYVEPPTLSEVLPSDLQESFDRRSYSKLLPAGSNRIPVDIKRSNQSFVYFFEDSAEIPMPVFSATQADEEGIIIHEGMRFQSDQKGNYVVQMVVTAPLMPVTMRIKLEVVDQGGHSFTLTLPPLPLPKPDRPDGNNLTGTYTLRQSGYSDLLASRYDGLAFLRRSGVARFGSLPKSRDEN